MWLMNVAQLHRRPAAEYFRLPPWVWEFESACAEVYWQEKVKQKGDE